MKAALPASLALALAAIPGWSQQISFKADEVAPGIFMLEGQGGFAGGNLGLMIGEDGVVVIDDGLEPLSDTTLAAVRDVTDRDVEFVINTHVHGDHVGGNPAFADAGATIIGHDNVRRRLEEEGWPGANGNTPAPAKALPQITFSQSMTFHLNGHDAFVFHVEAAHTDGDSVIVFRDANVIHTGDVLFNGTYPFIDLDSGGSLSGYLAAQEDVLSLANADTRIIPGHGPLATVADLRKAHDMLADARDRVQKLVRQGKSEEEVVAANPLALYDDEWSWQFITTESMTRTIYTSLTRNAPEGDR